LPIGAVLGAAMAAGKSNTEIQQVLSEAEQLVATLRDVHASTARPTSTDLAIAFQNKENAGVVGLLRRRLATTAAEDCEPASKAQRF
jgi:predicted acylesterase/phospholipase RssA